jgi:hypothetical protein
LAEFLGEDCEYFGMAVSFCRGSESCKQESAALDLVDVWRVRVSAILTVCFLTICVAIILLVRVVGVVLLVVAVVESPNSFPLNCER